MKLLSVVLFLAQMNAQPLPVTSMQMTPDQIALSLRTRRPIMAPSDCHALDLWECHPDEPKRITDISLRWVQLDSDAELEAILVVEAPAEMSKVAYVFDKQETWKLVGSFFCKENRCDVNRLIRVQQLTDDSPRLLLCYRDLGGSGSSIDTIEGFQLRDGKLWPALEVTEYEWSAFPSARETIQRVYRSSNRLVVHTIEQRPPGTVVKNECEVLGWSPNDHSFMRLMRDQQNYCNNRTGKPLAGKSYSAGL